MRQAKGARVPTVALEQLGYLCRDVDVYHLIDRTGLGAGRVGSEMDAAGRWMFNHRMGGGHLWWKEFVNRPAGEWGDVAEHLASDFFTKQGLPLVVDGSHLKQLGLHRHFSALRSSDNWMMVNGFEFVGGAVACVVSIYEASSASIGYKTDLSLACDGAFVALSLAGAVATCNPLLIIASVVRVTTLVRRVGMGCGIRSGSPFDLHPDVLLGVPSVELALEELLSLNISVEFEVDGRGGVLSADGLVPHERRPGRHR